MPGRRRRVCDLGHTVKIRAAPHVFGLLLQVQGWLTTARTGKQDRKQVAADLKALGPSQGLGCFCFRSSSKPNCVVLCVLVEKDRYVCPVACHHPPVWSVT